MRRSAFRPGSRRRRWKQAAYADAAIFTVLAVLFLYGVDGAAAWMLAVACLAMVFLSLLSARLGWRIRYDLPPEHYRRLRSPNPMTREIAREAAEATRLAALDPNRPRYAFQLQRRRRAENTDA